MSSSQASSQQSRPRRRQLTAQLPEAMRRFLANETGSAGLLAAAALIALVWANSPWSGSYERLWHTVFELRLGSASLALDLRHWLDSGLMAIFFFVVGLEVRREWSMGEFTDRRRVLVPLMGAIGGMLVPATMYALLAPDDARIGWGIVIATDTAFVLGALALVGPRSSTQLRLFLLTTAIVDDIAAISVIALVYTEAVELGWLLAAGGLLVLFGLLGVLQVWRGPAYLCVGVLVWYATLRSGVHATIAGMLTGLLVSAFVPPRTRVERAARHARAFRQSPLPEVAQQARMSVTRAISPNERMLVVLHPWASYVIVPVFALAFAGVDLRGGVLEEALRSRVTWAIAIALVLGKGIGITLGALGTARAGFGVVPRGVGSWQIAGGGVLSGIGFTVSLLIAELAFDDEHVRTQAKIGILLAVVLAIIAGWVVFRLAAVLRGQVTASLPTVLDPPVDPELDHVRGPLDAPLELVEYADFECPYCSKSTGTVEELLERFDGRLRYVMRHLPLEDVHEHAVDAALAAEAAHEQGRFWEYHDVLFRHQDDLEVEDLIAHAARLGLDVDRFVDDFASESVAARVRRHVASAEASGATGTPTFYVNGTRLEGQWDTVTLAAALEAAHDPSGSGASGR